MIITKKTIYQIEERLVTLARGTRYKEGIRLIDNYVKKYGKVDELLTQKAFFYYHYAAFIKYGGGHVEKRAKLIQWYFQHAIDICRSIIEKLDDIENKNLLNSRLYLAQIYAMLGIAGRAKKIALQTFKYKPSSLTAERAADVCLRIQDNRGALLWYKKSVNLAKNSASRLMSRIGIAITYKRMGDSKTSLRHALKAFGLLKRARKDINVLFLKKMLYSHFPELRK